jgi:hypothetical protein
LAPSFSTNATIGNVSRSPHLFQLSGRPEAIGRVRLFAADRPEAHGLRVSVLVFWISNTMRKVTIVVPVLLMSCQVSDHWKIGPPHTTMTASASAKVAGRPAWRAVQSTSLSKPVLLMRAPLRVIGLPSCFSYRSGVS